MKYLISILSLVFFSYPVHAGIPSCTDMEAWVNKTETYSQFKPLNRYSDLQMSRMYGLALHDENFVPVFGKSFIQMKLKTRKKIMKKLIKCFSHKTWVNKGFAYAFYGPHNGQDPWLNMAKSVNTKSLAEIENARNLVIARNKVALENSQRNKNFLRDWRKKEQQRAEQDYLKKNDPHLRKNTSSEYKKEAMEMALVLKFVKNNNAPAYSFASYSSADFLQRIYDGNFEGFPVGFNDLKTNNLMMGMKKVSLIKKRSHYLYMYLEHYSKHCASSHKKDYRQFISQYKYTNKNAYGIQSETTSAKKYYYLKPQFYNDFVRIDKNNATDNGMGALLVLNSLQKILTTFPNDLDRMFNNLSCDNPVLNQLETNLLLAAKGKSSVQKLSPF